MNTILLIFVIIGSAWCDSGRWGGHAGYGRRGPSGRPPPPPYLKNLTEKAQDEYMKIVSNMRTTIAQQKEEVMKWAAQYNVEEQVKEFNANMTKLKNEVKQNVTDMVSQLPAGVKKFSDLMDNENQTFPEQMKALKQLCFEDKKQCYVLGCIMKEVTSISHGRFNNGNDKLDGRPWSQENEDFFGSHGNSEDNKSNWAHVSADSSESQEHNDSREHGKTSGNQRAESA
ncbi:hypothetical protein DICVIV_07841 [Dictyocaulus viviparus]|uniref:SXP/RAL-2 family protein Ani s 5-like cation-binding domain-containing protein n=1 Tax=Dictyocaulus viviparus TaxID=29172 RepID=A0A0D8XQN7_DICVI|nr:hypothetical protein DICVIV_07841 [Dictyocaulus viviparus]